MSGSKSSNKGKAAERELCKFLIGLFGGSFIRADSSGAYIGGKNAFRRNTMSETQIRSKKSDIVPPDFMPRLVIESKFYADFRFHQLLQPGSMVQLDEWISQTLDAVEDGDFWVVAFKINLRGWYVCIPDSFVEDMVFDNHVHYTSKTHGKFVVTDLKSCFEMNKTEILRLSA